MNGRARTAFIVLPVFITVVIALLVGVLAVLQNQRQTDQESKAESVGQDYLSSVATFRVSTTRQIHAVDSDDPKKLERVVAAAMARPPRLSAVSAYGRDHSAAYRQAERTEASLLSPYRRLRTVLRHAETSDTFIAAARKVLGLRATDYVGTGLISDSSRLRSELIPAFSEARDAFARVAVPTGQAELAAKVRDAVQYVIDESSVLAARIDARQNFSFHYDEQFQAALDAVNDYATEVQGDVEEAIQAATNGS
jgi:flagellar basal body-associated protein FliL